MDDDKFDLIFMPEIDFQAKASKFKTQHIRLNVLDIRKVS